MTEDAEMKRPVTLKALAEHLGLSQTTISLVLNDAPGAKSLSAATRQRVHNAAERLNYHPNVHAHILGARHAGSSKVRTSDNRNADDQARRLFKLEEEIAKLKQLVTELRLERPSQNKQPITSKH
jgi:DNA-binding LacI/PurR family transcriptional regulator